jgi:hypothetical protein
MGIKLIDDGNNKSHLRWDSASVNTSKITNTLQDAAKNLHLKGIGAFVETNQSSPNFGQPVDPDTLTNGQLAIILDKYYTMTTLNEAKAYYINKAKSDAQELANDEANNRY